MDSDKNKTMTDQSFYAPEARILVVDDTRMNLIVIKGLLEQTGIQIDTADCGRDCLFLAEKGKYHMIFLDIRMPEMDGIETLHRLLMLEGYQDKTIPVIALTANAISGTREEYVKEGFFDYLSKPVDAKELEKIMLTYLPKELVQTQKAEGQYRPPSDDGMGELPDIAGLDAVMGVQLCRTVDTFQKALKEFWLTASDRIQEIENYIQEENYNDYTIKVHALKSSSRIIGAKKLSEMAEYLEECGDRKDIGEIKQKNSEFVEHYKELADAIKAYIDAKEDYHARPVIERDTLMDALHTIYEFVEMFDFDSVDSVMEMLDEYAIPDAYHEGIQRLKVLLIGVERDDIMRHIEAMETQESPEPVQDDSLVIPDLDVESAVEALGGSVEKYISILKVFAEDEKDRLTQMDECISTENMELYTVYAHSLKSSTAIIGASELSKLAEKLETAGKEGNSTYIHESHSEFITKTNHVLDDLVCFLQQRSSGETQDKAQGDKECLLDNLTKITEALAEYEINAADEALSQLDNRQWSNAISIMISEIGQKMRNFDYEDAQSLVGRLLEMEEN